MKQLERLACLRNVVQSVWRDRNHLGHAPLPVVERIAIAYLMVPVFVWLLGWFEWWFAIPACAALGVCLLPVLTGPWRVRCRPGAFALAFVAFAWTMVTASGGVFDGNIPEWVDHRSLLLDLGRQSWPPYVRDDLADHLGGQDALALLRHYIGWHIVPALAARYWGVDALNWALPLWTAVGVALILLLFTRGWRGGRVFLAAGIFVFFGGMDMLRIVADDTVRFDFRVDHIDWMGLSGRTTALDSHMAALMFVPKHFLPAGLYALLLLRAGRNPRFLAVSGILLAAAPLWSAFVAVGLLPLVAVVIWRAGEQQFWRRWPPSQWIAAIGRVSTNAGLRRLLTWSNLGVAPALCALILLYLASGTLDFRSYFLWDYEWSEIVRGTLKFYLTEFLALTVLLVVLRPSLLRKPLFVVSVLTLLFLPLYEYGPSNDLLLRGGMPALMMICHYCVVVCLRPAVGGPGRSWFGMLCRCVVFACLVGSVFVGALGAGVSLVRAALNDAPFRFERSGFTVFAADARYIAEDVAWTVLVPLRWLLRDDPGGRDGSVAGGEPLLRLNDFDMYFGQKRLMLVREQCPQGLEADPVLVAFLPSDVDTNARTKWSFPLRRVGSGCGVQVGLPGYAVESICVGQIERFGARLHAVSPWEAKLTIDSAGQVRNAELAPGCYAQHDMAFQDAVMLWRIYGRVKKRAPLARARFNVYRDNSAGADQLVLVRESCGVQDTLARFFLHIHPLNITSLPGHRRESAFDNLDFVFGERGVMKDGRCVLLIRLPDYAISRVSVGQFDSGGEHWRAAVDW